MQRVLILGATSAIASEAAQLYVSRGDRVHLVGRNAGKLARLAERLNSDRVTTQPADFCDMPANASVIEQSITTLGALDIVLIAHGDLGDQIECEHSFEAAQKMIDVNFTSVVALLLPIANHMERNRHGRIGVISSVAAERGRPRNYTYGAAKGALNVYLQGLRTRLYAANVSVTTLKPGPVDTPMTESHSKHVLFGKPAAVARDIVAAIDRGTAETFVPFVWSVIMPIVRNTPEALFQKLPFLSGR